MLQIDDTLVSLDLIERFFHCDLDSCHGECCIEGDAGAPLLKEEYDKLLAATPIVWNDLTPAARRVLEEQGPAYYDEDEDLVTSIVDGRDCVFTTYAPGGMCLCALEKAHREGRLKDFRKPQSCHLYPVRLKDFAGLTAVNFHRWKICKCAEVLGRKRNMRAYQFLKDPLTTRFGAKWYAELCEAAGAWLAQRPDK